LLSELDRERKRLTRFLILGTINHLIFLFVILFAYVSSGFKTTGDAYGGLMMVYALSIFMPQFIFGVIALVIVVVNGCKGRLKGTKKKYSILYFVTLFFVALTSFVI